ncbi:HD domain-containing protein [Flagellimonas baculiformis]|uniref:HD domain-containing protein n=1 Tax=Flagellimonas baculiformis TaxID=3067310 RepID=UPI00296E2CB0|nr:HD domain-containing protein [Muricauda sp. D6]
MIPNSTLLEQAESYAKQLLINVLDPNFLYHNIDHTLRVVQSVREMAEYHRLPKQETETLLLAAWLHDIGYIKDPQHHEDKGMVMARDFLEKHGCPENRIKKVESLIAATKMGYKPKDFSEKIICDADCSHFGQASYHIIAEHLRQEFIKRGIVSYSPKEWAEQNIDLLQNRHTFYTPYAKDNWEPIKQENIKKLLTENVSLDDCTTNGPSDKTS